MGKIHPQINEDGVRRRMESWYWDKHRWSLGAFAFLKPYQQLGLYKDVVAPEGRIYFAGEHASTQPGWIEGAVESSLRAVKEMLVAGFPSLTNVVNNDNVNYLTTHTFSGLSSSSDSFPLRRYKTSILGQGNFQNNSCV